MQTITDRLLEVHKLAGCMMLTHTTHSLLARRSSTLSSPRRWKQLCERRRQARPAMHPAHRSHQRLR